MGAAWDFIRHVLAVAVEFLLSLLPEQSMGAGGGGGDMGGFIDGGDFEFDTEGGSDSESVEDDLADRIFKDFCMGK